MTLGSSAGKSPVATIPNLMNASRQPAAARAGSGRIVLVAGEAGVGKSALVEALVPLVTDTRVHLLACDGQFTPRPLGPLVDLAADVGGRLDVLWRAGAERSELFAALL